MYFIHWHKKLWLLASTMKVLTDNDMTGFLLVLKIIITVLMIINKMQISVVVTPEPKKHILHLYCLVYNMY